MREQPGQRSIDPLQKTTLTTHWIYFTWHSKLALRMKFTDFDSHLFYRPRKTLKSSMLFQVEAPGIDRAEKFPYRSKVFKLRINHEWILFANYDQSLNSFPRSELLPETYREQKQTFTPGNLSDLRLRCEWPECKTRISKRTRTTLSKTAYNWNTIRQTYIMDENTLNIELQLELQGITRRKHHSLLFE